ncbi:sulfurtransferase complex subunit TusB [Motilimonas cestriensis]|uniref:sulfurtransferase complex subunit TusB n=1 Tax=Motilimonas cestriensis TaxID=2742685 RepID=UPI003DA4BD50
MILHTVKHSPFNHKSLEQVLPRLGQDDYLLLIENSVVAVTVTHELSEALNELASQQRLFVLEPDLLARGLSSSVGNLVDYKGFVSLVEKADTTISW